MIVINVMIHSNNFLFADDTKLIKIILTKQYTIDIQYDFNNLLHNVIKST